MFCPQEKAAIQGWPDVNPMDLSSHELGLALGNAWTLPVPARIVESLNKVMGWQPDAKSKMKV